MGKARVIEMEDRKILKESRSERGITQDVLAERLHMLRNGLSQNMTRQRISLGMFVKILDAMDYDVVVIDRTSGESKWRVRPEE